MMMPARTSRVALGLVVLLFGSRSVAAEKTGVEAKAAFARLKTLSGEWKVTEGGEACHVPPDQAKILYKVTANGSALTETFFPGAKMEMVSVYHLDGDDLRLTHYCAAGNQPRMKLDRQASTADNLVFLFDGGSNLDPAKDMHIHSGRIAFLDKGKVEGSWDAFQGGKLAMSSKFSMSRP